MLDNPPLPLNQSASSPHLAIGAENLDEVTPVTPMPNEGVTGNWLNYQRGNTGNTGNTEKSNGSGEIERFLTRVVPPGGFMVVTTKSNQGAIYNRFFPRDQLQAAAA